MNDFLLDQAIAYPVVTSVNDKLTDTWLDA
jgi:hypothetical protein